MSPPVAKKRHAKRASFNEADSEDATVPLLSGDNDAPPLVDHMMASASDASSLTVTSDSVLAEEFDVRLVKSEGRGLGVTIAGYVGSQGLRKKR